MSNPFATLVILGLLAFLVESLVEYFVGVIFAKVTKLAPYTWVQIYVAAAFGIALCLSFKIDIIALAAQGAGVAPWSSSIVGMILTGLIISRGSNFLHDLVSRFLTKPND